MNLFVFILIQYFEDFHVKGSEAVESFKENLNTFKEYWTKYTQGSNGETINQSNIISLFSELPPPLGFSDYTNKKLIAREVL